MPQLINSSAAQSSNYKLNGMDLLASFSVLPTPAFVFSTAARQKLGWGGLGTRLWTFHYVANGLRNLKLLCWYSSNYILQEVVINAK